MWPFFWTNLYPFTQECWVPSLVEIGAMIFKFRWLDVYIGKGCGPSLENLNSLHPRMFRAKFGWNWLRGSCEMILKFCHVFLLFRNFLIYEKGVALHWKKIESLHPRNFCIKFGWNGPVVLEKKLFLISSTYFRYLSVISPWKRAGPLIWTNLNPLQPRMICAKFSWNWPSDSWDSWDFFLFGQCIFSIS